MTANALSDTTATDFDRIARDYIAAWNAPAGGRRAAVEGVFAPRATYTDPLVAIEGHDAIAATIGAVQEQFAGCTFRLAGTVDGHHGQARFTWSLGPAAKELVVGFDVVTLDDTGRITTVLGFLDKVPS